MATSWTKQAIVHEISPLTTLYIYDRHVFAVWQASAKFDPRNVGETYHEEVLLGS